MQAAPEEPVNEGWASFDNDDAPAIAESAEPAKEVPEADPEAPEKPRTEEPAKEEPVTEEPVSKEPEKIAVVNPESSGEDDEEKKPDSFLKKMCKCLIKFYFTNEFLILILAAILIAFAYPPIGAIYLAPKITATWIAVMFIFLLAGFGLKTEEFSKASQQCGFNLFIFFFNFGIDSALVFGVSRLLVTYSIINQDLADGMVIAASLPLTINMCVVLTKASGGDEAAAIINTAMWNMTGVFLSPVLILAYIGQSGTVNRWKVFYKLAARVLLPIVLGQLLKFYVPLVADFVKKWKPKFKQAQMYALVFIVYTIFCRTFINPENRVPAKDVFIMIAFIGICLCILMVLAWYLLQLFFRKEVKLRIMGLYGCTHKTAAMGIPLINAIYEGNPAIGLYTLPLLIWHPMQLVFGTFLAPRLLAWSEACDAEADDLSLEETDAKDEKPETEKAEPEPDIEKPRISKRKSEIADTDGVWIEDQEYPSDEFTIRSAEVSV